MKLLWPVLIALPLLGQNCIPPSPLNPNDSQTDALTDVSCHLADGTKVAQFSLVVPVRGTLSLNAKGSGLSVLIRNADGRRVDSGTTVQHYMEAGSYRVLVNGSVNGKFTLVSTFQPERNILCTSFRLLGVGQSVTGQLGANSCKLPDGSAYDGWQTTVYGAGTLTLSMTATAFNSFLILRSQSGNLLAIDDTSGGKNAQISIAVSGRETYMVLASAASSTEKPGVYQLSVAFAPNDDETCKPVAVITDPGPVNGSTSAASCNFNLPGRQDSSLFNVYRLHVAIEGAVQLSVSNSTFTPLLLLLDANGNAIAEDSESGGLYTPLIVQSLSAGDYFVLVYNEDSFEGDYQLEYGFIPGFAPSCPIQKLNNGDSVSGLLRGISGCREADFLSDTYSVVMTTAGTLDLSLASSDFTTFLALRDAKNNLLLYGDQNLDGTSAHLHTRLAAGTYFINAATVDLPGNYSLNALVVASPVPACTVTQNLPVNTGFVAYLGQGPCIGSSGEAVDFYRFTTTSDGTAALIMTSGDLDSELTLTDSGGKVLRVDNNSYAQSDALIVQYLKAGTYQLEARASDRAGTGKYRVDLLFTSGSKPPYCSATSLAIGTVKSSTLTYTGCQYYDDTFSNFYRFQVTDPTKPVSLSGASSKFDAFLVLLDAKGNIISTDDNSGDRTDALISALLDTGVYFVVVKPAADPTQSGAYTVSIKQ